MAYHLYRFLIGDDIDCAIAASSKIPRKNDNRLKNDKHIFLDIYRLRDYTEQVSERKHTCPMKKIRHYVILYERVVMHKMCAIKPNSNWQHFY